jgi:RNA polymerase-binding transcription factor DksA
MVVVGGVHFSFEWHDTMDDDPIVQKKHPNLYNFLCERLPQLGLDVETYGPYIWGGTDDDNNDTDDSTGITKDKEEWEQVMELLQASSETHSDDDTVWKELLLEMQEKIRLDASMNKQEHDRFVQEKKKQWEDDLAKAKLEQEQKHHQPKEEKKLSSAIDDETKKILMQRYGYDEPDEDPGDVMQATSITTNKQAAEAANLEKAKELRKTKVQTKQEEQRKTKEQRLQKEKAKEERRKRTQKGERKR